MGWGSSLRWLFLFEGGHSAWLFKEGLASFLLFSRPSCVLFFVDMAFFVTLVWACECIYILHGGEQGERERQTDGQTDCRLLYYYYHHQHPASAAFSGSLILCFFGLPAMEWACHSFHHHHHHHHHHHNHRASLGGERSFSVFFCVVGCLRDCFVGIGAVVPFGIGGHCTATLRCTYSLELTT
jgi:hypothetical protein